jgi:rhodanese-related sulfurtransferase
MNVEEIEPKEAVADVQSGESVFVDVREPYELDEVKYGVDHIHIPLGEIQARITEIPKDKMVIVGCRSGKRSMNACMFFKMQGYENIRNLEGGIMNWIESGCPIG